MCNYLIFYLYFTHKSVFLHNQKKQARSRSLTLVHEGFTFSHAQKPQNTPANIDETSLFGLFSSEGMRGRGVGVSCPIVVTFYLFILFIYFLYIIIYIL